VLRPLEVDEDEVLVLLLVEEVELDMAEVVGAPSLIEV